MSLTSTRTARKLLGDLRRLSNPRNIQGMARYGITPARPPGVSVKELRVLAKEIPYICKGAYDDRNCVRKAVSWSLRQIGKRSVMLHWEALQIAKDLAGTVSKSAVWVGRDAIADLDRTEVRARIRRRERS